MNTQEKRMKGRKNQGTLLPWVGLSSFLTVEKSNGSGEMDSGFSVLIFHSVALLSHSRAKKYHNPGGQTGIIFPHTTTQLPLSVEIIISPYHLGRGFCSLAHQDLVGLKSSFLGY